MMAGCRPTGVMGGKATRPDTTAHAQLAACPSFTACNCNRSIIDLSRCPPEVRLLNPGPRCLVLVLPKVCSLAVCPSSTHLHVMADAEAAADAEAEGLLRHDSSGGSPPPELSDVSELRRLTPRDLLVVKSRILSLLARLGRTLPRPIGL